MKERLTGAIILVVLVVALVPELLSGPKSAPPRTPITSADGAPIRSVVIHFGEAAGTSGAAGAAGPVPAPTSAPTATAASASAPTPALVTATTPPPAPAPPPDARTAMSPAMSPAIEAPATAAEVPTPAPPPAPKPHPEAPHPRSAPAAPAREAFLVQAGLFSNRGNADRLRESLASHGLDAHLAVLHKGTSELYQVCVGPAQERPAATALLERVKATGSSGLLVPQPRPATHSP